VKNYFKRMALWLKTLLMESRMRTRLVTKVAIKNTELRKVWWMIVVMPFVGPFLQTFHNDIPEIIRVKT
jgi:hypothetical protein